MCAKAPPALLARPEEEKKVEVEPPPGETAAVGAEAEVLAEPVAARMLAEDRGMATAGEEAPAVGEKEAAAEEASAVKGGKAPKGDAGPPVAPAEHRRSVADKVTTAEEEEAPAVATWEDAVAPKVVQVPADVAAREDDRRRHHPE